MSLKKRCFTYCNDCPRGVSPWKIVEVTSEDAEIYNIKKAGCVACEPRDEKDCDRKCGKGCQQKKPCFTQNNFKKCCREEKDCFDKNCVNQACTLISVKNPHTTLVLPEIADTDIPDVIGEAVDLTHWTDIVPDALRAFDNATGTYTAFEEGDYNVELVVNYQTNVPINVSPSLTDVPSIEIYDACTGEHILASTFPTLCIIVPVPCCVSSEEPPIDVHVDTILCKAQVIISAVIPLCCCQRIRVRALTNGLTYTPTLLPPIPASIDFSPAGLDTTLTIYKVRNTPIVKIDCNN